MAVRNNYSSNDESSVRNVSSRTPYRPVSLNPEMRNVSVTAGGAYSYRCALKSD
jgi:hypothetical protein